MPRRKAILTKKEDIIKYWVNKIYEGELNFDWSEANIMCWNCGCERDTERCHIVPYALQGKDIPENYVLLCKDCHKSAPNCNSSTFMWDWIKSNRTITGFTGSYYWEKAVEGYEKIYKNSFYNELLSLNLKDPFIILEENTKWLEENQDYYTNHFGEEINQSSRIGSLRGFILYMKQKYAPTSL